MFIDPFKDWCKENGIKHDKKTQFLDAGLSSIDPVKCGQFSEKTLYTDVSRAMSKKSIMADFLWSLDIPIEILKRPYCKSWIIYHMSLDGSFETLTEYNGFLTDV